MKPKKTRTSDVFAAFVVDQLSELESVTTRPMFGGVGFYCGGVFFGIAAQDVLYLKADEATRPAFLKRRMKPFMPYGKKTNGPHRYYSVPLDVLESPPALCEWARAAVAAAKRLSG
jgi:DNA transformation protein